MNQIVGAVIGRLCAAMVLGYGFLSANGQQLAEPAATVAQEPAAAQTPSAIAPLHWASGGDRSASVCLPVDWTIAQVRDGALTAKGPHSEWLALGMVFMVLDPDSGQSKALAHNPSYSNSPRLKFPEDTDLFAAFTDAVNQLRNKSNLPPATFALLHARKLNAAKGQLPPIEATYNLDLADGAGPRKATAHIEALRYRGMPQWLLAVSSSSIPLSYVAEEEATLLAVIGSYRQNLSAISIDGGHGDPIHRDHDHGGFMPGEYPAPPNCEAIATGATLASSPHATTER